MRFTRITLLLACVSVPVLALSTCTDGGEPTSPMPVTALDKKPVKTTRATLDSGTTEASATAGSVWEPVLRVVPNWEDIFDSQTIGPRGGTLTAGDITLTIPARALSEDTQITMLTLQGENMYVLFWPHGLQFAKAARLSFAVDKTNAKDAESGDLQGVYFESLFGDTPSALENFSVNKGKGIATFDINHFSYYSLFIRRGYTAAGAD